MLTFIVFTIAFSIMAILNILIGAFIGWVIFYLILLFGKIIVFTFNTIREDIRTLII